MIASMAIGFAVSVFFSAVAMAGFAFSLWDAGQRNKARVGFLSAAMLAGLSVTVFLEALRVFHG